MFTQSYSLLKAYFARWRAERERNVLSSMPRSLKEEIYLVTRKNLHVSRKRAEWSVKNILGSPKLLTWQQKHLDAVLLQVGLIGPFLAVRQPSSARFALSGEIAESVQRMAAVSSTGTGRARPR